MSDQIMQQLVEMSNYLGDPDNTFAILGEGNTSARIDEDTFCVKASGTCLATMTKGDFLPVSISKVVGILDDPNAGDDDVAKVLRAGVLDPEEKRKPSVETMLHAVLLQYPEFRFIGHAHPVFTNALLCSKQAETLAGGRICPDHIVLMGHKSVFVPYVDPGLVLAREVRDRVRKFIDEEGVLPKAIMMESHGLFAMASTATKVMNIFDMAEKIARIIVGTSAFGGPKFLSETDIMRIDSRPDEKYRQQAIATQ